MVYPLLLKAIVARDNGPYYAEDGCLLELILRLFW